MRLGVLLTGDASHPALAALRAGLAERGLVEGRDLAIEARFDGGRASSLPDLAAELVSLRPDAIAAVGANQCRAAQRATASIPIVFAVIVDPVAVGIVPDAIRPGGNATGLTTFDPAQAAEQIALLRALLPGMRRLAIVGDGNAPAALPEANRAAAEAADLDVLLLRPGAAEDLDAAFASMRDHGSEALLALPLPLVSSNTPGILDLARAARLPTLLGRDAARFGPLLAYGTSLAAASLRMAGTLANVLAGASPAEIPVETFIRPDLAVDLRMARAIGIAVPAGLLSRAGSVAG